MKGRRIVPALIGILWVLFSASNAAAQTQAHADLKDGEGKAVGKANFRETKEGMLIEVQVKGLAPGLHAVHIHATGKCEGPKFASAGGHFNPGQKKHGLKSEEGPHAGDLPNMDVTKDGIGRYETLTTRITLKPGESFILDEDGSALVIHATGDDNATDPAGNAGDRIACGVIVKGAPKKK